jgi:hypothetical protein
MMRSGRIIPLLSLAGAFAIIGALLAPLRTTPRASAATLSATLSPMPVNLPPLDYAPVRKYLDAHCIECHGDKLQKGDITLNHYPDTASVLKGRKVFEDVLEKIRAG